MGALDGAGNGDRDVTRELKRTLDDWDLLRATTDDAEQAKTADELEGLAARVRANVQGSDRLKANRGAEQGHRRVRQAPTVPPPLVKRYNDAVLRYERNRDGTLRNIVANLDGYEAHPTLQLTSA